MTKKENTDSTPLLTVLMLSYNNEDFVAEALESVLQQKDFHDFEIVITDDASKDGTADIIRSYAEQFPDIIKPHINPINLGITDNFNQTLQRCRGKYISFLAADDLYEPTKLVKQIRLMEENPGCVLSYHNVRVFGSAVAKDYSYYGGLRGRKAHTLKNGDISVFITERNFLVAPSVMVKRESVPAHGFYPQIPRISDWLFFAEIARNGDVLYIDEILGGYRRHQTNTTSSYLDIGEFEKSYQILEDNYPTYKESILKGRVRLYLSYFVYFLMKGNTKKSLSCMRKALRLTSLGGIHTYSFVFKAFFRDLYQYSMRLISGWRI